MFQFQLTGKTNMFHRADIGGARDKGLHFPKSACNLDATQHSPDLG
jgi:hypothetical protein